MAILYSFGSTIGSQGRSRAEFAENADEGNGDDAYRFWGEETDQIAEAKAKAQTLSDEPFIDAGLTPKPLVWKDHPDDIPGVGFAAGFGPVVYAWEIWTEDAPDD